MAVRERGEDVPICERRWIFNEECSRWFFGPERKVAGRERMRDDWTGRSVRSRGRNVRGREAIADEYDDGFPRQFVPAQSPGGGGVFEFRNQSAAERERDGKFGEHSSPDADVEFVGEQ